MIEASTPNAADLVSVRSRVSWGAIAAGAMVALTTYVVLTILGVALGIELVLRGTDENLGVGATIYSIVVLLLAMFIGGWATSRLAVGESKLEAVLYGLILWGVVFIGMVWLLSSGMRVGFATLFGAASGAYATDDGRLDINRVANDLKQAGVDESTVKKYRGYYERVHDNPAATAEVGRELSGDAAARLVARQASWWSLAGILVSLATVVIGSLIGAGELLQPVPILGVRRVPVDRGGRTV